MYWPGVNYAGSIDKTGTNKKEEQQTENERQRSQIEKNSYTQQIHKQRVENLIHNTLTNVKKTEILNIV